MLGKHHRLPNAFAGCLIPPHTKLARYLGKVRDASATGSYCLQVHDAKNNIICMDAQDSLYDVGYLCARTPRQYRFHPSPPNYGHYINSLRPEQLEGADYNALIQSDPTEGFSWSVSRPSPIPTGAEILAPYGDDFWLNPPPSPTASKAFSSDPTGDGPPWWSRANASTHFLDDEGLNYSLFGPDHIIIRSVSNGVRLLHADIERVLNGEIGVAELRLEPLLYHVHGQHMPWVPLLHQLYQEAGCTLGLTAFVQRIFAPALESLHQQPEDHYLLRILHSTPTSDLDSLLLHESTLFALLVGLHLRVFIWTPG